ncbi:MAG: acyl carrier protein [Terrimicrobiaceae bacterium]
MSTPPSTAEIENILVAEISRMFPDVPAVNAGTPLQSLGLDSLRLFEIFVLVEKRFGESLVDGPITRGMLENPSALATHIAGRIAAKAA